MVKWCVREILYVHLTLLCYLTVVNVCIVFMHGNINVFMHIFL